ncbi:MAG: lipid A biosynthesis acyltransferase [Micavibrio aeruginosavorus]|uniref:Lipid A biosynthesis acyltransferase n=1 Tax=Micavibrio aeruginosavorus TaxID=349221 RepID=A0A2W5FHL7_9BACT|nr:MAG: lipid A biosynthesis acyltransferase [Micavibrio aeruginosavorus]
MKSLRYAIEGILVSFLIGLFRRLPVDTASNLGGSIARHIGPALSVNRKALRNIRAAFPKKSEAEYKQIIYGMWDNIGRTFAEYPHLEKIAAERITSVGDEHIRHILDSGGPSILFTGHLANWEVAGAYAYTLGMQLDLIYRSPNNPNVEGILQECRSMGEKIKTYPKSSQGMRDVMSALKAGRHIGILIDQKYNQGMAMPFFGRTAMTSPAYVQLAQRFDCPLHPARIERKNGANFHITIFPPMHIKDRAVEDVITESHMMLEEWITERPDQWLWLHNRWKSKENGV